MNSKTIKYLQHRTAQLSIGSSTLRNQGAPGVAKATRTFLSELNLKSFSVTSKQKFSKALDHTTIALSKALPKGARNWGTARKAVNIFLRDCVYNRFLCSHFAIHLIHPWLEVPLDSHVANGLRETSMRNTLPKWTTIKKLERKVSDKYQEAATKVAEKVGCKRVDLDIYLWRQTGIKELKNI
ncbi:MAG: hypothetical protein OEV59_05535 [Deltaproteobacteria bacterium]|nr:hypothetical protein [Deltaproteobacteria bacterium]